MTQVPYVPSAHDNIGTAEEIAFEARAQEGSIWTGARVMIGVWSFTFGALAFSYFYLRSTNSGGLWRPHDMTAPTGFGAAIMALAVASAVVTWFGLRRLREGMVTDWNVWWWSAVLGGSLAFALQIWELTDLPFAPGASGYSSVFIAWGCMDLVLLFAGVYWSETILARFIRVRLAVSRGADASTVTLLHDRLFRVNAEACAFFWAFLAAVSVFFWVFFYLSS